MKSRLNPLVICSVNFWNRFKEKCFRRHTRVLVPFRETKDISKFTVPHFSRGEGAVHSNVEHVYVKKGPDVK